MIRTASPVPFLELLELEQRAGMMRVGLAYKAAVLQAARSESVGFYLAGELVAAALMYPLEPELAGEDLRELVFIVTPPARRHLVAIARAACSTRRALAESRVRLRAWCRQSNLAGRRLALLCGLRKAGTAGAWRRYEWSGNVEFRARHLRHKGLAQAVRGGRAAAAGNRGSGRGAHAAGHAEPGR